MDQLWSLGICAKIAEVQISASGQFLPQSDFRDCCSGQPGIACGMSMFMSDIASIAMTVEDAITVSAKPMLAGPRMTPSTAKTQSRR